MSARLGRRPPDPRWHETVEVSTSGCCDRAVLRPWPSDGQLEKWCEVAFFYPISELPDSWEEGVFWGVRGRNDIIS